MATPQSLHKPSDQGSAQNPHRRTLKELSKAHFDTDEASAYLREEHNLDMPPSMMVMRRSLGKPPAFVGAAGFIRYNKSDLDAFAHSFARQVGLSTKGFDEPKREGRMSESEKRRLSNGKK